MFKCSVCYKIAKELPIKCPFVGSSVFVTVVVLNVTSSPSSFCKDFKGIVNETHDWKFKLDDMHENVLNNNLNDITRAILFIYMHGNVLNNSLNDVTHVVFMTLFIYIHSSI